MKVIIKSKDTVEKDDSLFGLLSQHKKNISYLRIMINEEEKLISLQITDNPKNWLNLPAEKYSGFKMLKRNEIGVTKFSIKYITPGIIIAHFGQTIGVKFPNGKAEIDNQLSAKSFFTLDCSSKYLESIVLNMRKMINMTPQKKYEIIETYLSANPTAVQ
ncbi:MAG: hypothetical protein KAZ87_01270 [Spirochaetes bacterium]|nr:hypothetical protein [Spirochaetota bacterium]